MNYKLKIFYVFIFYLLFCKKQKIISGSIVAIASNHRIIFLIKISINLILY